MKSMRLALIALTLITVAAPASADHTPGHTRLSPPFIPTPAEYEGQCWPLPEATGCSAERGTSRIAATATFDTGAMGSLPTTFTYTSSTVKTGLLLEHRVAEGTRSIRMVINISRVYEETERANPNAVSATGWVRIDTPYENCWGCGTMVQLEPGRGEQEIEIVVGSEQFPLRAGDLRIVISVLADVRIQDWTLVAEPSVTIPRIPTTVCVPARPYEWCVGNSPVTVKVPISTWQAHGRAHAAVTVNSVDIYES